MKKTVFKYFGWILLIVGIIGSMTSVVYADYYTRTMNFVKSFGYSCSHPEVSPCAYKIMVKSYQTGNRFFVWYPDKLGITEGQDVVITLEDRSGDTYWIKITNTDNGSESEILKVVTVE